MLCVRSDGSPENYILEYLSETDPQKILDLSKGDETDGDFDEYSGEKGEGEKGESEEGRFGEQKDFEMRFAVSVGGMAEKKRREHRKRKVEPAAAAMEECVTDSQQLSTRIRTVGCDKCFCAPILSIGNRHVVNMCDALLLLGRDKELDRTYCEVFTAKLPEVSLSLTFHNR